MKLHAKSITVLVVTLVIGIAIGALGWSTIHNQREDRLREMRRQGGLYGYIDRYIDPVDSLQEDRLRSLSSAYHDTLSRFWRHYMWHRTELMKEFESDLSPELSEEQAIAMRPFFERNTRMPKSARRDSTRNEADSTATQAATDSAAASTSAADSTNAAN